MTEIWYGLVKAVELIVSLDPEVVEVVGRSLIVSGSACVIASVICLPLASLIHFRSFPGKRVIINLIQTLFSLPTVLVGLFLFVLLSRGGPLGGLGLLFTPAAMVIGQTLLISPVLLGLTISALNGVARELIDTAVSLGADGFQVAWLALREARYAVMAAVIMAFGRAISEVGCAVMVGGNIKGFTRVITTTISLESSKGDLELSIALGIILLLIALLVNVSLSRLQQR
jgi:tungstate transport system permease protein